MKRLMFQLKIWIELKLFSILIQIGYLKPPKDKKNDKSDIEKKARSKKLEKPLSFEVPNPNPDKDSGKTIDEGGSVTIDRIDDPLKAVKIAMDNRVAMKEKLTETIAEYPCAIEEATRLQFHKKLVEHNQELLEGPPPTLVYKLPPFKATLEPI